MHRTCEEATVAGGVSNSYSGRKQEVNIRGRVLDMFNEEPSDIDDVIIINVGGFRHEVLRVTLSKIPNTRLAQLEKTCRRYYRKSKDEYYFDRHPGAFAAILNLFRTGELHVPFDCCGSLFANELKFWGISEEDIEQCCWIKYNSDIDQKNSLVVFKEFSEEEQVTCTRQCDNWPKWQMRVWQILDKPFSSTLAKLYAILSYTVVVISVIGLILESHPVGQIPLTLENFAEYLGTDNMTEVEEQLNTTDLRNELHQEVHPVLFDLDIFCLCFFTIEWTIRLIFSPNKLKYLRHPFTIIDLVAMIPFYVELIVHEFFTEEKYKLSFVDKLFVLYTLRIFKLFRIAMHIDGFKVIVYTMKASWREMLLLVFCLLIQMVFFGSLIYVAEHGISSDINNLPIGLWWAIVTMTTVGYGDFYPKTVGGYCVGALCAVFGVLVIAFTVPTMVNNFMLFYNAIQYRRHRPSKIEDTLIYQNNDKRNDSGDIANAFSESQSAITTGRNSNKKKSSEINKSNSNNSVNNDSTNCSMVKVDSQMSLSGSSSYVKALEANTKRFHTSKVNNTCYKWVDPD